MFVRKRFLSCVFLMLISGLGLAGARAEESPAGSPAKQIFKEDFESGNPGLMLGGQIDFDQGDGPWSVTAENGKLVFFNESSSKHTHYDIIRWVQYEGSGTLTPTRQSEMAVTVTPMNSGKGGAGIAVLSGRRGDYWMFAVAREGEYHVLRKQQGKLELAYSGRHRALAEEASNRVSYRILGSQIVFSANGADIARVPIDRLKDLQSEPALAVFGLGRFEFDDVVITGKAHATGDRPRTKKINSGGLQEPVPGKRLEEVQGAAQKSRLRPLSGNTVF